VFECVINISEGRRQPLLDQLSSAAGASLRDRHADAFHNRSVFTLINTAEALVPDVHRLIEAGLRELNLSEHHGVHPRLGVVDVVPYVGLAPDSLEGAVILRDTTATWVADTFHVPVFLYGPVNGVDRSLPYVRKHAFADLTPDRGPVGASPREGALCVGARELLVAWNLWLTGVSLHQARELAASVRQPGVRALGLQVGDDVQVSCNIVDVTITRPSVVYDQVSDQLTTGQSIARAELVGLAPASLLHREDPARWGALGLSEAATIESRLGERR